MEALLSCLVIYVAYRLGVFTWANVTKTVVVLLWCLKWYAIYRLIKFPIDIWRNVRRIKRENEALRIADEKWERAVAANDDVAKKEAAFEWAEVSGREEAAMARNERRIQCSNHGCNAKPQPQPYPGNLEDVAAFFRLLSALYQQLVLWAIRTLRLAKPMKPEWA